MKKINDILSAYHQDQIEKPEFIRTMYEQHHAGLFDYAEYLSNTNIKRIEIEDNQVIMTSRDRGVRMVCVPGDFRVAPIETLNFGDYEKSDSAMINLLMGDCGVFLDIGANMGWYSINIAISRRSAQIHCFEPIPKTYEYLQRNINLNAVSNITTYNFGLSNRKGDFDFYYYDEGSGNASSANLSNRDDVRVYKCSVRTLDDFSAELQKPIDFIKCDVEGAELLVFEGGLKTINRDNPIIFSEILRKWSKKFNYDPNEIFAFFKNQGYRAFTVDQGQLKEFFTMKESTVETNFFFLHIQKHAMQIRQFCH